MEQVGIFFKAQTELKSLVDAVKSLDDFSTASDKTGKAMQDLSGKAKDFLPTVDKETRKIVDIVEKFRSESPGEFAPAEGLFSNLKRKITEPDEPEAALPQKPTAITPEIKNTLDEIEKFQTKGSESFQKIIQKYDEFQKAGKKATDAQRNEIKKLIDEYEKLAKLKMLDIQKTEIAGAKKISEAAKQAEIPQEKEALADLGAALKSQSISKLEAAQVKEIKEGVSAPAARAPEQPSAVDKWDDRLKSAGKFIIGGSLIGMAIQSVRHWSDVNTELTKVQQRFDGMSSGLDSWGAKFGYMKRESIELSRAWSEITNNFDKTEAAQYTGFARMADIRPDQAYQLRMSGRFVEQGGSQEFLTKFERLAKEMGMDKGRIAELISVTSEMSRTAASQKFGATAEDVTRAQRFSATLWEQAGDKERGIGQRGAEFTARLNQAIANPGGDAEKAFMLRAVGYGKPGTDLWKAETKIQEGVYGGNLRSVMEQLQRETPDDQQYQKYMLKGLFGGQLKNMEIDQLVGQWNDPKEREKLLAAYEKKDETEALKDFDKVAQSTISAGETVKIAIEKMQVESMQKFEPLINEVVKGIPTIIKDVDNITSGIADVVKGINSVVDVFGLPGKISGGLNDVNEWAAKAGKSTREAIVGFFKNSSENDMYFPKAVSDWEGSANIHKKPKEDIAGLLLPVVRDDIKPEKEPKFDIPPLIALAPDKIEKISVQAKETESKIDKNEGWLIVLAQIAEYVGRIEANTQSLRDFSRMAPENQFVPDSGIGYRSESVRQSN